MRCDVDSWKDKDYGVIWSCHVYLKDKTEVEFSFGAPSWASTQPTDEGTFKVITDGCRVLYDPIEPIWGLYPGAASRLIISLTKHRLSLAVALASVLS